MAATHSRQLIMIILLWQALILSDICAAPVQIPTLMKCGSGVETQPCFFANPVTQQKYVGENGTTAWEIQVPTDDAQELPLKNYTLTTASRTLIEGTKVKDEQEKNRWNIAYYLSESSTSKQPTEYTTIKIQLQITELQSHDELIVRIELKLRESVWVTPHVKLFKVNKRPSTQRPSPPEPTLEPTPESTSFEPTPKPTSFEPTPKPTSFEPTPKPTSFEPTPKPTSIKPTPEEEEEAVQPVVIYNEGKDNSNILYAILTLCICIFVSTFFGLDAALIMRKVNSAFDRVRKTHFYQRHFPSCLQKSDSDSSHASINSLQQVSDNESDNRSERGPSGAAQAESSAAPRTVGARQQQEPTDTVPDTEDVPQPDSRPHELIELLPVQEMMNTRPDSND